MLLLLISLLLRIIYIINIVVLLSLFIVIVIIINPVLLLPLFSLLPFLIFHWNYASDKPVSKALGTKYS